MHHIRSQLVARIHKHHACEKCSCASEVINAMYDLEFLTVATDTERQQEIFKEKLIAFEERS